MFDQDVIATWEEIDSMNFTTAIWELFVDQAFFNEASDDVDEIWKDLLTRSGLTVFETITHGNRSTSFIEHVAAGDDK